MAVSIRDAKGSPDDREWIRDVYPEYLGDLSILNTGLFPVLGEHGHREPELLGRWFADDRSHPLLILKSDQPVGFALVVRPPAAFSSSSSAQSLIDYRMSEFFVRQPFRRLGVGRDAATLIFNRFSGRWEVTEYLRNSGAVSFWRRTISAHTHGKYTERIVDGEVRQVFQSFRRSVTGVSPNR